MGHWETGEGSSLKSTVTLKVTTSGQKEEDLQAPQSAPDYWDWGSNGLQKRESRVASWASTAALDHSATSWFHNKSYF